MPSRVTLTITTGRQAGTQINLVQRTCCIVGRARQCDPRVPDPKNPPEISRYHFLLDVNPPDIRIRDFGSLNGTFVNELRIGGRKQHQAVADVLDTNDPEHDLKDGDLIRMVQTTIRVNVDTGILCCCCFAEIPENRLSASEQSKGIYYCDRCRSESQEKTIVPMPRGSLTCRVCGADAGREVNRYRQGFFICKACRSQPVKLARQLVKTGDPNGEFPFADYTMVAELGRDFATATYLLRQNGTMNHKLLVLAPAKVPVDAKMKDLFLADLHQSQRLQHPNIEKILACGCVEGIFYLVKEHTGGEKLSDRIERGRLEPALALELTDQLLEALEYSHQITLPASQGIYAARHGWSHLAIAPQRIWITDDESPRALLMDYSVDDRFDRVGLGGLSRTGAETLKPDYLSRQQLFDYGGTQPTIDVWQVAACLYAMLTQHPPRDFTQGKDPWKIVLQTEPVPIRERNANIPAPLAAIIDRALDDAKEFHFTSASEFRSALRNVR